MYNTLESNLDEASLLERAAAVEQLLQDTEISEQDKQSALMEFLELLNRQRAANVGVVFSERLLTRVSNAFHSHPTSDLATDLLYACLMLQQFHAMQFDQWRSDPAIKECTPALSSLEADGKLSDCFRFCQETAQTYAEARFWPEALDYAKRAHEYAKKLLKKNVTLLENGEMLDLRDTACVICDYALHTKDGVDSKLEEMLQKDLGAENYQAALQEAMDNQDDTDIDPVEFSPEYLAIRFELEEKIDDALEHQRGYYDYCKDYWMAKRLILRSDYGIHGKSPATLNPNSEFH